MSGGRAVGGGVTPRERQIRTREGRGHQLRALARAGRRAACALALLAPVAASAEPTAPSDPAATTTVVLWHAYRGAEAAGLEAAVAAFRERTSGTVHVEVLALPYEAIGSKLSTAIPRGNGPDLFVLAHERLGDFEAAGLVRALPELSAAEAAAFAPGTLVAVRGPATGRLYGLPLAYKCLALFYRPSLVPVAPVTLDDLLRVAAAHSRPAEGRYGLAYEAGSFYHHAVWLHAFGGEVLDASGRVVFSSPANAASLAFARSLVAEHRVTPEEASGALVTELFNTGRAAMSINGPWFIGEIAPGVDWAVAPLPTIEGRPAAPWLTVEAVFPAARPGDPPGTAASGPALALARFLAGPEGARARATIGGQLVAAPGVPLDSRLAAFAAELPFARPLPNNPVVRSIWEPAAQALRKVLRGAATPEEALRGAERHFAAITRPLPPPASPWPWVLGAAGLFAAVLAYRRLRASRRSRDEAARSMTTSLARPDPGTSTPPARNWKAALTPYALLAPAAVLLLVLVIVPLAVGAGLSFFSHRAGEFRFVALGNFIDVLSSRDFPATSPLSFWFTLAVTTLWTALNVALHVTIGVALALLLRDPWMRLKSVYRVLLIVPWAVPNYITALVWKGMFHKQFGAINAALVWLGVEPVSWFSRFSTAFAANVATNVWLGFPFMMVVTLGALQSIPRDVEEAAEVDGAGAWARFRHITLPLLRPALAPAVILGTVWTFNMFNVVFLVSGGEPDGATEILISEAFRWAFSRQEQYGIAATYAVLIFLILNGTTRLLGRLVEAR